jgi:hypothetical protein
VGSYSANRARGEGFRRGRARQLAIIHLPIACALISDLQQSILRVVTFLTVGTFQITVPSGSLAIVAFRDGESRPATAGDDEHLQPLVVARAHSGSIQSRHARTRVGHPYFSKNGDAGKYPSTLRPLPSKSFCRACWLGGLFCAGAATSE